MKTGYSTVQIALHWLVATLVLVQYLTSGSMDRVHHAAHEGSEVNSWDMLQHDLHIWIGMAAGALMVLRFVVRWWADGSSLFAFDGKPIEKVARALHLGFYAALIGQAALGVAAAYLTSRAAPLHALGSKVILGMLVLHIGAAAGHALLGDGTVLRILRPVRPGKG